MKFNYKYLLIFILICLNKIQSCPKGTFKNNNGSCETCPQGFYNSSDNSDYCTPCPEGTWNWYYTAENRVSCSGCGKGSYLNEKHQCMSCDQGTFSTDLNSTKCKQCPEGTWNWYYTAENRVSCSGCGKGSYLNEKHQCMSCDQGTYNDEIIAKVCKPCQEGTWNYFYTSDNRINCTGCGKGRFMLGNHMCSDCPPGEYSIIENSIKCTKVPPGYEYTSIDKEPIKCDNGYSSGGFSKCLKCPNNICDIISLDNYKIEKVKKMLEYSKLSYNLEESTSIKVIKSSETNSKALIGYDESINSIFISFRGTDNWDNIISDAKFLKESLVELNDCTDCKVHTGFKSGFDSLVNQIDKEFQNLIKSYPNAEIVVTGHSYGAALASIEAIHLENTGNKISLITFGSPRVGNKNFSDYSNLKISGLNIRVTYEDDPVTSIPPTTLNFMHIGTEINYFNNKDYYVYPKNLDRLNNIDSFSIGDHSRYWDMLENKQLKFIY